MRREARTLPALSALLFRRCPISRLAVLPVILARSPLLSQISPVFMIRERWGARFSYPVQAPNQGIFMSDRTMGDVRERQFMKRSKAFPRGRVSSDSDTGEFEALLLTVISLGYQGFAIESGLLQIGLSSKTQGRVQSLACLVIRTPSVVQRTMPENLGEEGFIHFTRSVNC